MKTLLIMRHAKSDWESGSNSDFDRPLNSRGLITAPQMGETLKESNLCPDLIISSPAQRAKSTAMAVAAEINYSTEIQFTETFYFGNLDQITKLICSTDNNTEKLMVVGHNPTWEGLVYFLSGKYLQMKTANIAVIEFDVNDWSKINKSNAKFVEVLAPK